MSTMLDNEEWRDVFGTQNYLQVSNLGRVKRFSRAKDKRKQRYTVKIFTPSPPKNNVWVQGRGSVDIAILILEAFVGLCPDGMECCHNDDDRSNNRLDNLRWDTHRENVKDGYKNGATRRRDNRRRSFNSPHYTNSWRYEHDNNVNCE